MVEHDVDNIGKLEVLCGGPPLDLLDQCLHLLWVPPDDALLLSELELPRPPDRKGWDFGMARGERLGDVKPFVLPLLDILMKVPLNQSSFWLLLTMAPPHSARSEPLDFGLTLKIFSHRPKCGSKWRAS